MIFSHKRRRPLRRVHNELWVTEPDSEQIEVLTGPSARRVTPRHVSYIRVPGGREALVIDGAHGFAYTEPGTKTMRVNLKKRTIADRFHRTDDEARVLLG
jgi:hypothetical protein